MPHVTGFQAFRSSFPSFIVFASGNVDSLKPAAQNPGRGISGMPT
jgi:hypothetical protein